MPTDTEVTDVSFRLEQTLHTAAALHELCNEQIQKMRSGDEHPFVVIREALRGIARDMENCAEVLRSTPGDLGFFNGHFGSV